MGKGIVAEEIEALYEEKKRILKRLQEIQKEITELKDLNKYLKEIRND